MFVLLKFRVDTRSDWYKENGVSWGDIRWKYCFSLSLSTLSICIWTASVYATIIDQHFSQYMVYTHNDTRTTLVYLWMRVFFSFLLLNATAPRPFLSLLLLFFSFFRINYSFTTTRKKTSTNKSIRCSQPLTIFTPQSLLLYNMLVVVFKKIPFESAHHTHPIQSVSRMYNFHPCHVCRN